MVVYTVEYVPHPPASYLLLLGDPFHGPQGVWVAHVAGQGLHQ